MILTNEDVNAESFETWNAKQHGDPEEIGFLQALRIAYCHGQDSMKKAVERTVIEKLCAGVEMPEPFRKQGQQMAYDGDDKVFFDCFSADQLRAYGAAQRLKAIQDCDDVVSELSHDASRGDCWQAIRALKGETP